MDCGGSSPHDENTGPILASWGTREGGRCVSKGAKWNEGVDVID